MPTDPAAAERRSLDVLGAALALPVDDRDVLVQTRCAHLDNQVSAELAVLPAVSYAVRIRHACSYELAGRR